MTNEKYIVNDYSLEHVRNRYEVEVLQMLRDKLPEEKDFCGCKICIEDVYALAMNALPSHYVQTSSIILKKGPPTETDISRTVVDAIDAVMVRPNHP